MYGKFIIKYIQFCWFPHGHLKHAQKIHKITQKLNQISSFLFSELLCNPEILKASKDLIDLLEAPK